jgi:hypothetical protein
MVATPATLVVLMAAASLTHPQYRPGHITWLDDQEQSHWAV